MSLLVDSTMGLGEVGDWREKMNLIKWRSFNLRHAVNEGFCLLIEFAWIEENEFARFTNENFNAF